jgi:hypothetical protein
MASSLPRSSHARENAPPLLPARIIAVGKAPQQSARSDIRTSAVQYGYLAWAGYLQRSRVLDRRCILVTSASGSARHWLRPVAQAWRFRDHRCAGRSEARELGRPASRLVGAHLHRPLRVSFATRPRLPDPRSLYFRPVSNPLGPVVTDESGWVLFTTGPNGSARLGTASTVSRDGVFVCDPQARTVLRIMPRLFHGTCAPAVSEPR